MNSTAAERKSLRAKAHHLDPVVRVGQSGLTDGVVEEVKRALWDHELIKIKVSVGDRETRRDTIAKLCDHSGAECVQTIGNVAVLYLPRPAETEH
jgi:RNA-binding protein